MLENIDMEFDTNVAVLYANNQIDRNESAVNYENMVNSEEYIIINDPIKRIADKNY